MKTATKILSLVVLSLLPWGFAFAESPAATAFAELKSLQGEWKMKGADGKVTYEVRSAGHSLVETMDDMVTVYHLDGESILMTHYCSAGNQPRLRAVNFASPLKSLDFHFVDGTNLQPGSPHINGLVIDFLSPDRVKESWTANGQESKPTVIELERVK